MVLITWHFKESKVVEDWTVSLVSFCNTAAIRLSRSIWGTLPVWVLTDKGGDSGRRAALVK